ncbi:MAG: hypothetical protein P8X87_04885 [Candidatus Bathyarchaeota archaeon]
MKLYWTAGCWFSLFLLSIYHSIICNYQTVFPVWYSTLIVWFTGVVALSSLGTKNDHEFS